MKRWRWYRWTVVIVGVESSHISPPMTFVRFRKLADAEAWCAGQNAKDSFGLTRWQAVAIDQGAKRR